MDAIDSFGEALIAAGRRGRLRRWTLGTLTFPRRPPRRVGQRGPGPFALIAFVLLLGAGTTIALAATGVILTGAPVPTSTRPVATAGAGIPAPGGAQLLPLRAVDPAGGLPWGMRIIRTTRGAICWQIGRIDDGRLGQLGIAGAFHNDGRFHPLPANALPGTLKNPSAYSFEGCETPGDTFAGDSVGLEANAARNPRAGSGIAAARREISFGLLGTHALSITYRSGSARRTERVLPGLGAYLIVQRYGGPASITSAPCRGHHRCFRGELGGFSSSNGSDHVPEVEYSIPARPNGALTAITYRYAGMTCTVDGTSPYLAIQRCGLSHGAPPRPRPLRSVSEPLKAHLQIHDRVITGAQISFTAPYPVTSDNQFYSASVRVGSGIGELTGTNFNIAQGATVSIPVRQLLSRARTRTVKLEVQYVRFPAGLPLQAQTIGTVTIHDPPGTRIPRPAAP